MVSVPFSAGKPSGKPVDLLTGSRRRAGGSGAPGRRRPRSIRCAPRRGRRRQRGPAGDGGRRVAVTAPRRAPRRGGDCVRPDRCRTVIPSLFAGRRNCYARERLSRAAGEHPTVRAFILHTDTMCDVRPRPPSLDKRASVKIALIAHLKFPIAQPYPGGLEMHTHLLAGALMRRGHDGDAVRLGGVRSDARAGLRLPPTGDGLGDPLRHAAIDRAESARLRADHGGGRGAATSTSCTTTASTTCRCAGAGRWRSRW